MEAKKISFAAGGKEATLYPAASAGAPLVVLNTYLGDGQSTVDKLEGLNAPDTSVLVVGALNWDHDMTPWFCPPLTKDDTPCTGGAGEYLPVLLDEIVPEAKERLGTEPSWLGIAGYSLAGLFAVWAAYNCNAFARVASMSGSLWFPDFLEYAQSHEMVRTPERIYLSLGKAEAKTPNRMLRCVQENTEALAEHFSSLGIPTTYELNPGNHFQDGALRSAKGIAAILA